MLGRRVGNGLPEPQKKGGPAGEGFEERDRELKRQQANNYKRRTRVVDMEPLAMGQRVWVKEAEGVQGREGIVLSEARGPRSYWVEIGGKRQRRNRKHLRKLGEVREGGLQRRRERRLLVWRRKGRSHLIVRIVGGRMGRTVIGRRRTRRVGQ